MIIRDPRNHIELMRPQMLVLMNSHLVFTARLASRKHPHQFGGPLRHGAKMHNGTWDFDCFRAWRKNHMSSCRMFLSKKCASWTARLLDY